MKYFRSLIMISVFFIALFSFACQNQKPLWKGTISTENGVTIVQNPKQPMYGEDILAIEEDLSIGESASSDDYLFSSIRAIAVDDAGNIYVLDRKDNHILVFDNTGKHLRTFGRAGQGPGEFTLPLTMGLTNRNEIVIEDYRNRLAYYSTEGEHIRDLPIAKTRVARVKVDSRGNILGIVIKRDEEDSRYEVQKFDPEMNLIHTLDSTPTPSADNQGFNPFRGSIYYAYDKDDRVITGISDRYEIKIYDTTGNLIKKIRREYDPVEITEEEKKEATESMPPDLKLVMPKYHSAYQWLMTDDEGRIFVMTQERIPGERGYYHDVFDTEGRYLAKIPFKFRPFLIKNKNYYTVQEDEDGYHVVKRYKAHWSISE
jgi:hypothetical protein